MASIDLSGITWSSAVIPLYAGNFDGNGFTISHLALSVASRLGLFGVLGEEARVKDLGVTDANVIGAFGGIGILAGINNGTAMNCFSIGIRYGYTMPIS